MELDKILIGNRIKLLRKDQNLTQEELASKLGLNNKSSISLYEKGEQIPSDDIKFAMASFFGCSLDYLLGLSDDRHGKANLSDKLFLIPIVGKIPAGEPLLAEDNIVAYLPIDPLMYKLSSPDNLFFLQVVGDSMNNVVPEGTYVLIKKQNYAENGDIIAAIINGDDEATLKRFKQIDDIFVMLEPDSSNPIHMQRIINLKDTDFKIIGKVIGDFKKWS